MLWACECVNHVIPLYRDERDERMDEALITALKWADGKASAGEARKAAVRAIALAREITDPVNKAIIRAVHHTVATAHMADHSLGGAIYSLIAVKNAGASYQDEREWQNKQLPEEIRDIILYGRAVKEKVFKLA